MNDASQYSVGIDLGGTAVKVVAVDAEGNVLARERFATADSREFASTVPGSSMVSGATDLPWVASIRECLANLRLRFGREASSVGVAAPGLASQDGRSIAWMQGRLAGLEGMDWTRLLERADVVPVMNDAHAALLGEAWIGSARGVANVVLLTLGTGVGGAIQCDGKLLRGRLGRAGHLGHVSLDPDGSLDIVRTPGSLEDAVGECSLMRRGRGRWRSTLELIRAAADGDADASAVWNRSVRALAAAVVGLINSVDPELVLLSGGIAAAGDALLKPLQRHLDEWEWRPTGVGVRVAMGTLGDFAGAVGAARHAAR